MLHLLVDSAEVQFFIGTGLFQIATNIPAD